MSAYVRKLSCPCAEQAESALETTGECKEVVALTSSPGGARAIGAKEGSCVACGCPSDRTFGTKDDAIYWSAFTSKGLVYVHIVINRTTNSLSYYEFPSVCFEGGPVWISNIPVNSLSVTTITTHSNQCAAELIS